MQVVKVAIVSENVTLNTLSRKATSNIAAIFDEVNSLKLVLVEYYNMASLKNQNFQASHSLFSGPNTVTWLVWKL